MTEHQSPYTVTPEEMRDAKEMLGAGYNDIPDRQAHYIRDEAPHDHFTSIPNLVDDMGLSPYAYRLYGHLRRVAGESGACWQSTKTLAEKCKMSMGMVSRCKHELAATTPPLIRIARKTKDGGDWYHEISITDIWSINHGSFSPHEGQVSPSENRPSPHETKKNPLSAEEKPITRSSASKELSPQDAYNLDLFTSRFGKFNSQREIERWLALVLKHGRPKALDILEWAQKREIDLTNRATLLDSLETAAEKWGGNGHKPSAKVEEYRTL